MRDSEELVVGSDPTVQSLPLQLIANHVVDFGVRGYAYENDAANGGLTLREIFPLDAADLDYRGGGLLAADGTRRPYPAVIDVMLRVLTDEGARRIAAFEAGRAAGDWWDIASTHSVVFIRRIRLKTEPF